ncbi:MAG: hypothetical protein A2452_07495 [Candidatus Firestonebacteria bacterium RIFOXYC2_FULL_39_67]|nr:MAG: hypothetical protein A2536_01610 [Candidatus Firestonebacteria bacterium RIFOXYD2_FULL_39_29]OGF52950.1 MAG: hypothetical protein A2497_00080 [Candidatus Firestonebacteria bacterium RifOxyC12_full_39_7]OGF55502.1 MAG: hypothetical protein A2452_07495 [Candidatus Firestonebacteria bacterium RIFOXYC2_FULL_39_67]
MFIEEVNSTIDFLIDGSKSVIRYPALKLKELFASVKGNARVMIITYPGFSIPSAWLGAYQSLFILSLGVSNLQYGNIIGIAIIVQIFAQLLGGVLADRYGHKRILDIFTLFWPLSVLVFAFAQNIWWVIPAIIMQNLLMITTPSWYCLFVEGIPKNKRSNIYAVVHMLLNGGALFLPVAGLLIKFYGLDKASRVIYLISAVLTSGAIYYRWKHMTETKLGEKARKEKKPIKIFVEAGRFREAFKYLAGKKDLFWYGVVNVTFLCALTMWTSFNSIFLADTKAAAFKEWSIMVFPMISAISFAVAIIVFVPLIRKHNYLKYIGIGIILNAIASAFYIFAPAKSMTFIILSYMTYGAGLALFRPLYDARLINAFKEKDRARLLSAYNTIVMLPSIAIGPITGFLYTGNPRYVFIAATCMFAISFLVLWKKVR